MLHQPDTEIIFPPRVIPSLRNLRGPEWREFVDGLCQHTTNDTHADILAFTWMMVKLNSCLACHADSYRAMRGCTLCSQNTIGRFKGTDAELIACFKVAREDILAWITANPSSPMLEILRQCFAAPSR
ncbi:MAG: hypothetical protein HY862_07245 [Chloroflexi bacterium]|nr:hypothetical protein [Chloroflexota bacterium]